MHVSSVTELYIIDPKIGVNNFGLKLKENGQRNWLKRALENQNGPNWDEIGNWPSPDQERDKLKWIAFSSNLMHKCRGSPNSCGTTTWREFHNESYKLLSYAM